MLKRFSESGLLMKECFAFFRGDKRMVIFPILSAGLAMILVAIFLKALLWSLYSSKLDMALWFEWIWYLVLVPAIGFISYFTILLSNVPLLQCAYARFSGERPSLGKGFQLMKSRWKQLFFLMADELQIHPRTWRVRIQGVTSTKKEKAIEKTGSYFTLPVVIFEELPPSAALERSKALIEENWGHGVVFVDGLRRALLLFIFLGWLILTNGALSNSPSIFLGGLLSLAVVLTVFDCLRQVYRAALYVYASAGRCPEGFNKTQLESAFE